MRDTCSSNGTFINSVRLSSANEKSQPYDLYSGDCVQFGVEVTEKKQVHSCVIASIHLFLPDGTEARPANITSEFGILDEYHHQKGFLYGPNSYLNTSLNITPSQLVELSHFISVAQNKQSMLESQIETLRHVLKTALEAAKDSWNSLVEEDRLLSRIETLQAKLEVLLVAKASSKEVTEDLKVESLKDEMIHIISDKENFEISTKSTLAKALEEKVVAMAKLHTTELELNNKESECNRLANLVDQNQKEIQNMISNYEKIRKDMEELVSKLKQAEEEQNKLCTKYEREKIELLERIDFLERLSNESKITNILLPEKALESIVQNDPSVQEGLKTNPNDSNIASQKVIKPNNNESSHLIENIDPSLLKGKHLKSFLHLFYFIYSFYRLK